MMDFDLRPVLYFIIIVTAAVLVGGYFIADWLFIDDGIRSEKPITPTLELIVKDNKVDTIYYYEKP